MEKIYFCWRKN